MLPQSVQPFSLSVGKLWVAVVTAYNQDDAIIRDVHATVKFVLIIIIRFGCSLGSPRLLFSELYHSIHRGVAVHRCESAHLTASEQSYLVWYILVPQSSKISGKWDSASLLHATVPRCIVSSLMGG